MAALGEWTKVNGDTTSNQSFISALYKTAFGRAADSGGMDFWLNAMANGKTRADVLQGFSSSNEMQDRLTGTDGRILVTQTTLSSEQGWILSSGNDRLDGGVGSDTLVGSDGIDTVVYSGNMSAYKFLLSKSGQIKIADMAAGADGTVARDTISSIELGEFNGQTVDLAFTQGDPAKLKMLGLLYQSLFDRPVDVNGLNYWLKADWSAQQYAQAMLADSEFVQRFGQLTDKAFVELLYHNTLSRDAESSGMKFWTDYLVSNYTRAELLGQWIMAAEVNSVQYGTDGLWLV